jgi:pilus assembly protein CpaC
MRNFIKTACGPVLAGLAGLAAATFAPIDANQALANGGKSKRAVAHESGPVTFSPDHQSTLRLTERDGFPIRRGIKLARNKSMLVELPRDLRDVIVSNPELMDAVVQSSNRVYLIGKKQGQSNVFFFDVNGEQIVTFEVVIEHDTAPLDALFARLIPGSNIKVEILNETVILTGTVRNPAESSRAADIASRFIVTPSGESDVRHKLKVINMLQVEGEEQVMLRVVVAEVERTVLKQFGMNIGATINSGNFATALLSENALPLTAALGLGKLPIPGINLKADATAACGQPGVVCNYNSGPGGSAFGNSGVDGFARGGRHTLAHAMRLMERNGLIRTLAEPNLTAISGETAKFLAGGEFPVPVSVNAGQVGITFKEFGVGVAFTPIVLSEGRINLKIETEVSELTDAGSISISGFQLPALKKRQAKSTVELPSGGTLAMAGLLSDDTRKNIDGMPGLKDLPVLGQLFRSQDFVKRETELMMMVTPYIVRPTARQNLARPTDGLAPASDIKSNVLGHMNRVYGKKADTIVGGGIKDDQIGFIVD